MAPARIAAADLTREIPSPGQSHMNQPRGPWADRSHAIDRSREGTYRMSLVFVHGVGNRVDDTRRYEEGIAARDALFRAYLLKLHRTEDGSPVKVINPLWGDLGAQLHWCGRSIPDRSSQEALANAQAAELVQFYLPKLSA